MNDLTKQHTEVPARGRALRDESEADLNGLEVYRHGTGLELCEIADTILNAASAPRYVGQKRDIIKSAVALHAAVIQVNVRPSFRQRIKLAWGVLRWNN